jgi:hypothetical protein
MNSEVIRGLAIALVTLLLILSIKTITVGYYVSIVHGSFLFISGMLIPVLIKFYLNK